MTGRQSIIFRTGNCATGPAADRHTLHPTPLLSNAAAARSALEELDLDRPLGRVAQAVGLEPGAGLDLQAGLQRQQDEEGDHVVGAQMEACVEVLPTADRRAPTGGALNQPVGHGVPPLGHPAALVDLPEHHEILLKHGGVKPVGRVRQDALGRDPCGGVQNPLARRLPQRLRHTGAVGVTRLARLVRAQAQIGQAFDQGGRQPLGLLLVDQAQQRDRPGQEMALVDRTAGMAYQPELVTVDEVRRDRLDGLGRLAGVVEETPEAAQLVQPALDHGLGTDRAGRRQVVAEGRGEAAGEPRPRPRGHVHPNGLAVGQRHGEPHCDKGLGFAARIRRRLGETRLPAARPAHGGASALASSTVQPSIAASMRARLSSRLSR